MMESELLQGMCIEPRFVCMGLEADTDQQALELLANQLWKEGVVKESYIPAVKLREKTFATGLLFEDMGIAIPHTDAEHVEEASIGIAILKQPIAFKAMGMPEEEVPVEMMFMMAIKEAHSQIEFLQALMEIFQTKGRLQTLQACTTAEAVVKTFKSFF